jgi:CRP/FNR family transcriptional regulator, cyclic AMP receptor protein
LSQETLARLIGATCQRVNQIMKDWERQGLVARRYGRIVMRDSAALESTAGL